MERADADAVAKARRGLEVAPLVLDVAETIVRLARQLWVARHARLGGGRVLVRVAVRVGADAGAVARADGVERERIRDERAVHRRARRVPAEAAVEVEDARLAEALHADRGARGARVRHRKH